MGGDYGHRDLFANQALILPGFIFLWFAVRRRLNDYFTRFILLFTYLFFEIVALFAIAQRVRAAAAAPLCAGDGIGPFAGCGVFAAPQWRSDWPALSLKGARMMLILAWPAFIRPSQYRRYARDHHAEDRRHPNHRVQGRATGSRPTWADQRAFVVRTGGILAECIQRTRRRCTPGTILSIRTSRCEEAATYAIYSDQNAGVAGRGDQHSVAESLRMPRDLRSGTDQPRDTINPFIHPYKFDGVLPVLWHEEDDTIYAVPQRTELAGARGSVKAPSSNGSRSMAWIPMKWRAMSPRWTMPRCPPTS